MKRVLILLEKWNDTVRIMHEDGIEVEVMLSQMHSKKKTVLSKSNKPETHKIDREYFVPFKEEGVKIKKWSDGYYKEILRHRQSIEWQEAKAQVREQKRQVRQQLKKIEFAETLPKDTPITNFKLVKQPQKDVYWYVCTLKVQRGRIITTMLVTNNELDENTSWRISRRDNGILLQSYKSWNRRFRTERWIKIKSLSVMKESDKGKIMEGLL